MRLPCLLNPPWNVHVKAITATLAASTLIFLKRQRVGGGPALIAGRHKRFLTRKRGVLLMNRHGTYAAHDQGVHVVVAIAGELQVRHRLDQPGDGNPAL